MIITIVFVLFALAATTYFLLIARRRAPGDVSYASLLDRLEPIDVPALQNLIDPRELAFLQSNLDPKALANLERMRNRALVVYVKRIVRNTDILLMCADAATRSEVPEIATAGTDLLSQAMRTRIRALSTLALLYGSRVIPSLAANVPQTVAGYTDVRQHSDSLASLFAR